MDRTHRILLNGLQQLQELENGTYHIKTNKNKLYVSHDDLPGHYDNTNTTVVPASGSSYPSCPSYPNALLLENFCTIGPDGKPNNLKLPTSLEEVNKSKSTFERLNSIKKKNASETLTECMSGIPKTKLKTTTSPSELICANCHSVGKMIEDQTEGSIRCGVCGLVSEGLFDHGPEWRQYNDDGYCEKNNRCGCPSNYFFPKSSQGTIITGVGSGKLKRKQKWYSVVYKEKSLNEVFEVIVSICYVNHIPKIISDTARIMYKKIHDSKHKTGVNAGKNVIIRGNNRRSIIATCVLKGCEMNKDPRPLKEIARMFGITEKKLSKGIKQFDKLMKNADDQCVIMDQLEETTPEDYIRKLCRPEFRNKFKIVLKMDELTKYEIDLAVRIANNCGKMKLASDHNPQSVAVGAILLMADKMNLSIDRKKIARLYGTSDVTVGKIYNKIIPFINGLVDDEATEHIIKTFKING